MARVDRAEVAPQRVAGQLGDLAGHLDPGRPAADDDEGQPRTAAHLVVLELGRLEGRQEPCSHGDGALERLDLRGRVAPLVVAEVGVVRAAGNDQRVVLQRAGGALADDRADVQPAPVEVEAGDLAEHHPDVPVAPEDRAERIADLPGRKRPSGHLVGEWLEQVEVAPVDQRELDRRGGQVRGGLQAAESAADYDHPVGRWRHDGHEIPPPPGLDPGRETTCPARDTANHAAPNAVTRCPLMSPGFGVPVKR